MKNWKIPAVLIPLIFLTLFAFGDLFSHSMPVVNICLVLLLGATIIWLLIVLLWKKIWNSTIFKNWRLPAIILLLLILAMAFRWGTLGTKSSNLTTYKYTIDHWNGAVYKEIFESSGYEKNIDKPSSIDSETLTGFWNIVIGINIIWLITAVSRIKKRDTENI